MVYYTIFANGCQVKMSCYSEVFNKPRLPILEEIQRGWEASR